MSSKIKVRIAVAINQEGDWSSCGWESANDEDMRSIAIENLDSLAEQIYWIEAELECPADKTATGVNVTPDNTLGE
ncbi:MAG: hypothetical protein AAGB04_00270 [Pseudomonadota bacterium]